MTQVPPHMLSNLPQSREAPGATTGFVLGLLSVILSGPIIGLVMGLIGYTTAKKARLLCDANPGFYTNAGLATAGYVLSIVGICVGALTSLCMCGYFVVIIGAIIAAAAAGH